jgi:hypothetical protein
MCTRCESELRANRDRLPDLPADAYGDDAIDLPEPEPDADRDADLDRIGHAFTDVDADPFGYPFAVPV